MALFQPVAMNAVERTRMRILWFILVLSAAGEAGLIALDVMRDRDITNNLLILLSLVTAGLILSTRRTSLAAYLLLIPFAIDFMRVVVEHGVNTHALPLLFLLVVEAVYFLPTFHALFYVGALTLAFNSTALMMSAETDLNQVSRLLVVADAIIIGITAIFTTVFVSMKRYFGSLTEQNEHLDELVQQRTGELEAERERSDQLLHSILPEKIVQRIKQGDTSPVDRMESASVLFADLSGFTTLSQSMEPDELVGLLNEVFSEMDRLAKRHRLEKIKTIGDAYMVAAGVPEAQEDDLIRLVEFALDLRELFASSARFMRPYGLRIGLNTGPVVAGVIGEQKFMYDLWGETVNIASRMESHGLEGRIQTTEHVRRTLRDRYVFTPRGEIDVAGVGSMNTWFLESKIPRPLADFAT